MPNDLPLDDDVAELNREAQRAVDRVIAARVELSAAIDNISAVRGKIADGSAAAVTFIDAYMNPAVQNPEPIAPDVALPAPVEEPPVFTTVQDEIVALDNSSGGESIVADVLDVVLPDPEATAFAESSDAAE